MFHGILVDMAFTDRHYPKTLPIYAQKITGGWGLFGIQVPRNDIENTVADIQAQMRTEEHFYNHLYDDETVIIIFKKCVFRVTSHASSWADAQSYGTRSGIPIEQLDFWPNRFQDEIHYFGREDFVET